MAAPTNWRATDLAKLYLLNGTIDVDAANKKMALFLSTSNVGQTSDVYGNLTNEHANANGYTTGGQAVSLTLSQVGATTTGNQAADTVWTANGGPITARFAVIYIDATVNGIIKPILFWCIVDSTPADVTATDGNTFTVKNPAAGVFTLTGGTA